MIARAYSDHAGDMERLASASLTKKERETLIRLLKQIGYEAAGKSGNEKIQRASGLAQKEKLRRHE